MIIKVSDLKRERLPISRNCVWGISDECQCWKCRTAKGLIVTQETEAAAEEVARLTASRLKLEVLKSLCNGKVCEEDLKNDQEKHAKDVEP